MTPQSLARYLFLFEARVTRKGYLITGTALMLLKYVGEVLAARMVYGVDYPLAAFIFPSYQLKPALFTNAGLYQSFDSFLGFYILWTLPFMWIGVSMSVRRAFDAGMTPGFGLLFLVPFVNYFNMLLLAAVPSDERVSVTPLAKAIPQVQADQWRAALGAVSAALLIAFPLLYLATVTKNSYGLSLFVGLPTVMGSVASWMWNRSQSRGLKSSVAISCFAISVAALALLLFAFEGVICIVMALPFAFAGGILGGIIGEYLAKRADQKTMRLQCCGVALVLALSVALEERINPPGSAFATTSIEIAADPMTVFRNVVEFSELPPPTELIFRAGVAYPIRARIEGSGVGAVRYCEFSTGPFIEPITAWEPGRRLAFSVTKQPPTMEELSLYKKISPRHLTETFRSVRGEFRITALGENRTLLEGTTWYELKMAPFAYWAFLTNQLVHTIHGRVLQHIKTLSEDFKARPHEYE